MGKMDHHHHHQRYGDDLLWMAIAGIGAAGVNLCEEAEELSRDNDSLDVDRDYDCHRRDVEEARAGNRKVLHLFVDKHGCP